MSQFDDELKSVVKKVDGAKAAILIGFDGIAVSEVQEGIEISLQDIMVECGQLLSETMKVAQGNDLGPVTEFSFSTAKHRVVIRVLDSNYFLGLILSSDGNVGQGRYVLRQASSVLKPLL